MIFPTVQKSDAGSFTWYRTDLLSTTHGMFCRSGGVSTYPFTSLNLSFGVGDDSDRVRENRQRIKQCLGLKHFVSVHQVHGNRILCLDNIRKDSEFSEYDGLITDQPGLGLLIQQADCQAVLLHDPVRQVIGAVHSGWKGSTLNISGKIVAEMRKNYSVNPADVRAVISPSLGPCCAEFINFEQELPKSFHPFQMQPGYFDFWTISRKQLIDAGLLDEHIETAAICTKCTKDFFSYRRAVRQGKGITGRNGSVIALS